ncbi:retrotransposon-like protein 1 [Entomophthora muscae]|uniref:Retrotransposon-like protein 1 n=1 Tax=Entomophthora muscae TaxID=34485 RepID=A0ACC2TPL3_9FUNG|nr:retrotransposon-like protein 1 [Entomophthora muscae]
MFCHSLNSASADKDAWEPAPPSLEKVFALAHKLGAKPAYLPKQGVFATLLVTKMAPPTKLAKPPKTASINVMCHPAQTPNWPTNSGSLPKFAALAEIPDVTSSNPSGTILALQNKEDLSYFLFNATFYTKFQKAKTTVLVDTGAGRNFMDLGLAQSLGLLLLPQTPVDASKVPVLCYPLFKPLSYCTGNHVFVSKFSAIEDLLYPVIVGMEWWRRHLVQIDVLSNKLHFLLDGAPGFLLLLLPGEDPPKSCLSLKALPDTPPPFVLPGILALYKDAFEVTLSNALPPLLP